MSFPLTSANFIVSLEWLFYGSLLKDVYVQVSCQFLHVITQRKNNLSLKIQIKVYLIMETFEYHLKTVKRKMQISSFHVQNVLSHKSNICAFIFSRHLF